MAKTPSPRGEDKAMKAKSPPRWGVGSGSSVATGAGQRGGVCPPLGTPAPVRSHCLCCPDGRGGQGHEGQVPIPGAYLKKKLKKKNLRFLASRSYSGVPALADFDRYCQNRQAGDPLLSSPTSLRTFILEIFFFKFFFQVCPRNGDLAFMALSSSSIGAT